MEPADPSPPSPAGEGKHGTRFALVLALLLPAGLAAQVRNPLAGLLWTELFVFLLPAVVTAAGCNLEPRAWLRLRRAPPAAIALGALTGLAGWFLGSALFAAARAVAPAELARRLDLSRLFDGPPALQAAFTVAAVGIAPICEELAFRGHLASAFHSRHRPAFAIGASALLFALLHLDPLRAPALAVLGALYGWLAWRTGSIWPGVVAHATNNAVAAALALALPAGPEAEDPTLGMALLGVLVGALGLALAIALFRAAVAPAPPPAAPARLDAADPSIRFHLGRVPSSLWLSVAAGAASLGALLR